MRAPSERFVYSTSSMSRTQETRSARRRRSQRGVALLLTLFIVLIVAAMVMQLAVATSSDYAVSSNEASMARLDGAVDVALVEARKALIEDAQSSAGGGGPMGSGASLAGSGPPGGDPNSKKDDADSLNDSWAHDQETTVGDLQVRVHVEDENRKFNLLNLVSKDQDYARASKERLIRIIDSLREFQGSQFDLNNSDAESIASNIQHWLEGNRRDFDRPALLSNKSDSPVTAALTIDEMLLVEGVNEFLLYDQKFDGIDYPGLSSVLTVWTSLEAGPVPKDDGSTPPGGDPSTNGQPTNSSSSSSTSTSGSSTAGTDGVGLAGKPRDPATSSGRSLGVKINLNTAPPCVLRSLMPAFDIPTDVIDGILKYRNQLDEDKLKSARDAGEYQGDAYPPGVDPATKLVDRSSYKSGDGGPPTHYFTSTDDLNKVDEWKNFGNDNSKKEFLKLVTTKSDVFSIYVTARPTNGFGASQGQGADAFGVTTTLPGGVDADDMPGGIVKRIRQVVWRRAVQSDAVLLPVVVREERFDRKLSVSDFPIDPKTGRPILR